MSASDTPGSRSPRNAKTSQGPAPLQTHLIQAEHGGPGHEKASDKLHGKMAVVVALAANLVIGTFKLLAGLLGNQSSVFSEAMHSYADAVNSAFLLIGLQKGSRAPDKTHPFGYGLETTLWAMLASVMMLGLAAYSIWMGFNRIWHPEHFQDFWISFSVLCGSIGLEMMAVNVASSAVLNEVEIEVEGWFKRFATAFKHVRTITSPTTRFVFYEDTTALLGAAVALIAITLSEFGAMIGWLPTQYQHIPDAAASILIGVMLLGLAVYLFLHNSKGLTGSSANPLVEDRIRQYVLNLHGVSQVHDLRTIDYGLSGVVVQMRLEVNPDIQVKDVDDLTERIRDRIQAREGNIKEVIIEVLADESSEDWSDQFYSLIEEGRDNAVLKPREERILRNVFEFTQSVVRDIMIPRTDVEYVEVSDTLDDLITLVVDTGHTRIPVYEEDIDNVIGMINAKDLFKVLDKPRDEVKLRDLLRPFDIYPENKPVSDLLEEFKRRKIQIAMVADEHGGFAGIVTVEDLLEEIVGELWDETDLEELALEHPEPNRLIVPGRMDIDELNELYSLSIPEEEFKTVGGFVFGTLGRVPKEGDTITFEELTLNVLAMEGHRVERVEMINVDPFVTVNGLSDSASDAGGNDVSFSA